MTTTASPCGICAAPPGSLETLSGGWFLCNRCGLAYLPDETGEPVAWATTQRSHPFGVSTIRPASAPKARARRKA